MATGLTLEELRKMGAQPVKKTGGLTLQEVESRRIQPTSFEEEEPTSFLGKARKFATDIVGGGKLGEGLGKALAAPKLQDNLTKVEKQSSDIELNLVKLINEKKARGQNTKKLEQTLSAHRENQSATRKSQENFIESLPSNKEVIGSTIKLGATAIAPTAAKGLGSLLKVGTAPTVLSGIGRGAASGALLGAGEGAAHGAGGAMEQDKTPEEIVKETAIGAGIGLAAGGALGALTGGVSTAIRKGIERNANFAKEFVSPKQTTAVKEEALYQGRFEDSGLFKKAEITPSNRDIQLAEAIDDVVSPKKTLSQNMASIRDKISITDKGVAEYIKANKSPFNTSQLRSKLNTGKEDLSLVFASDDSAEKTYDAVVRAFLKEVDKKDTLGLFEARKNFDQLPAIKKLLESDKLGENARKEIVLGVRRSANEYIASLLPEGNQYRELLMKESYMLEALGNAAKKNASVIGKSKVDLMMKNTPFLKWIIGSGIVGGLAGSTAIGILGGRN